FIEYSSFIKSFIFIASLSYVTKLYFIRNYNLVTYDRLAIKMNDLINEGYSMKTAKKKLISFAIKVTKGEITNDRIELLKLIKHL
ncbi:MAG: hypothetical protein K6F81_02825, partial [Acholeplasmatales bacterium]|nr:hypothetical protein [Acholeplasmatales bacterium]